MRNDYFATDKQIRAGLLLADKAASAVGGPVLYAKFGKHWIQPGEGHTCYLGVSGSGKTSCGTIPLIMSLIEAGESFVDVEPKGEHLEKTLEYAKATGYETYVFNFRDILRSNRFNPLTEPYRLHQTGALNNIELSAQMIGNLAEVLFRPEHSNDDFWPNSAKDLFIGVVNALFAYAAPSQVNLASASRMVSTGAEEVSEGRMTSSFYLKKFVQRMPADSIVAMQMAAFVNAPKETRGSIASVYLQGLAMFTRSKAMLDLFSGEGMSIGALTGDKKVGVYIIPPDENTAFNGVAGILISQLMSHFIRLAHERYNGRLPVRMNLVLEELGSMGRVIPELPNILAAGRSRNIRVHYVLQSMTQLADVYGAANASTILGNTDVKVAFRTSNWDTLQELSHMCGTREVNYGNRIVTEPLLKETELAAFQTGQALVMVSGALKYVTWLPFYDQVFDFTDWKAPQIPERKIPGTVPMFDVCAYVDGYDQELFGDDDEDDDDDDDELPFPVFSSRSHDGLTGVQNSLDHREKPAPLQPAHKAGCNVVVIGAGDNKTAVIKAMAAAGHLSIGTVAAQLRHLPASVSFVNMEEARSVVRAVNQAGGLAVLEE